MKKILCGILAFCCICFGGCAENTNVMIGGASDPDVVTISENGEQFMYRQITQEEAKKIMDSQQNFVILDTREQDEFDHGHIPGAVLIPHTQIDEMASEILPDKDAQILVYCRTGRRSKIAAEALARIGYTNVLEFGGITDWKYDIEK